MAAGAVVAAAFMAFAVSVVMIVVVMAVIVMMIMVVAVFDAMGMHIFMVMMMHNNILLNILWFLRIIIAQSSVFVKKQYPLAIFKPNAATVKHSIGKYPPVRLAKITAMK